MRRFEKIAIIKKRDKERKQKEKEGTNKCESWKWEEWKEDRKEEEKIDVEAREDWPVDKIDFSFTVILAKPRIELDGTGTHWPTDEGFNWPMNLGMDLPAVKLPENLGVEITAMLDTVGDDELPVDLHSLPAQTKNEPEYAEQNMKLGVDLPSIPAQNEKSKHLSDKSINSTEDITLKQDLELISENGYELKQIVREELPRDVTIEKVSESFYNVENDKVDGLDVDKLDVRLDADTCVELDVDKNDNRNIDFCEIKLVVNKNDVELEYDKYVELDHDNDVALDVEKIVIKKMDNNEVELDGDKNEKSDEKEVELDDKNVTRSDVDAANDVELDDDIIVTKKMDTDEVKLDGDKGVKSDKKEIKLDDKIATGKDVELEVDKIINRSIDKNEVELDVDKNENELELDAKKDVELDVVKYDPKKIDKSEVELDGNKDVTPVVANNDSGNRNEKVVELVVDKNNVVLDVGNELDVVKKVAKKLDKSPLILERVEMLFKNVSKVESVKLETPKARKKPNRKPKHNEKNQPKITSFMKKKCEVGGFIKMVDKKRYTPTPPTTEEVEGGKRSSKLIYEWPLPVASPISSRGQNPVGNLKKSYPTLLAKKPPKAFTNTARSITIAIPATQTTKKTLSGTPPKAHPKTRIPPESWVRQLDESKVAFPPFPKELDKHGIRKQSVPTERAQLEKANGPKVRDRVAFFSARKRRRLIDEYGDELDDEKPVKKMKDDIMNGICDEGKCEMKNQLEIMKISNSNVNSKMLATGMKRELGIEHAQNLPGTPSMNKIWELRSKQGTKGESSSLN